MKRLMLAAVGLCGALAGCGSSGTAPDGSGSARIVGVKTDYVLQGTSPAQYVACDMNNVNDSRMSKTQVVVTFAASGSVQTVTATLRGVTGSGNDSSVVLDASKLVKDANGNYNAVFDFDSQQGNVLPASIIVEPSQPVIRTPRTTTVNPKDRVGAFYADLIVKTATSSIPLTSRGLGTTDVYSNCTVNTATATPLSR